MITKNSRPRSPSVISTLPASTSRSSVISAILPRSRREQCSKRGTDLRRAVFAFDLSGMARFYAAASGQRALVGTTSWSVRHGALRVPDLQETDLAHVDAGEGMADERVEAFVVDLDVEDAAAARGHVDRLDAVERVRRAHVAVRIGGVENRADDVESG